MRAIQLRSHAKTIKRLVGLSKLRIPIQASH